MKTVKICMVANAGIVLRLVPAAAAVLSIFGCGESGAPTVSAAGPLLKVQTARVEEVRGNAFEAAPGTVRARLRATIEARVGGNIDKLPVVEGQAVEAGQLLIGLDVREIKAKLDQALAVKEQAERDLLRYANLLQQRAVTQVEFDGVQAKARVARAGADEAQTMLGYAQIAAPFKGVITKKFANVGDLAAPGKPLVELEDLTALRFEANIPETLIANVKPGSAVEVTIPAISRSLSGVVAEVAPSADPVSRSFLVKLDLPAAVDLRAGLYGQAAIPLSAATVLRAPRGVLLQRGQMEIVFVVENGKALMRLVRAARIDQAAVEFSAGLQSGEILVLDPPAHLKDGQPVEAH